MSIPACVQMFCKVHGLHGGFPCCSISAQNNHQKSFLDKSSKSGSGYHSMLGVAKRSPRLLYILLENVKGMQQRRKKFNSEIPMEIQQKALKRLGFHCVFSCLVNSSQYGLAQSRTRSWSLFVRETNLRPDFRLDILLQICSETTRSGPPDLECHVSVLHQSCLVCKAECSR